MNSSSPSGFDRAPDAAGGGLHILITDPFFRTSAQAGMTRTDDLAHLWVQSGHRVTVLAGAGHGAQPSGAVSILAASDDPVAFGHGETASLAQRFCFGAIFKIWRAKHIDAIVVTDRPARALPFFAFFALWRGIPLILDVRHGLPPTPHPSAPISHKCRAVLGRVALRLAAAFAKHVTTITPTLKEELTAVGFADSKVTVSVLASKTHGWPVEAPSWILAQAPEIAKRPLVVFAGSMPPERKLERIIEIIAAMPARSANFIFCGDGAARPLLEARAFELGLTNTNLLFPGAVPRAEVMALLRHAHIAITDCSPEARGGFLFDALASGKPVVLLGHGWQRDVTEGRGAGLSLPVNDAEAAGRELADFLGDGDGLRRAGQQAAALAAGRFNLDRVAGEFRILIEEIVAAAPREAVLRRRALRAKRGLDIIAATTGLIVLSPLMLIIALTIWAKTGGPVLFKQNRTGLHGRFFTLVKFRTMSVAKGASGQAGDEARLTPLGRFLRRTSLDELPELFNVLRGDMSLVGPRPLLPEYLPYYDAEQRRRHDVKPGLTGWAQVNGRNAVSWEERFKLDVWYVDNLSFGLDLRILARTLLVALRGDGINAEGHATMPRFDEVMARRQGAEDV